MNKFLGIFRDLLSVRFSEIKELSEKGIVYRGLTHGDLSALVTFIGCDSAVNLTLLRRLIYKIAGMRLVFVAFDTGVTPHRLIGADIYKWKFNGKLGWTLHEELILVHKEFRGNGIATTIRQHALSYYKIWNISGVTTTIYSTNKASLHSALNAGWKIISETDVSSSMSPGRKRYTLFSPIKSISRVSGKP
jgi:GNAT superfamily N-acetyltransferase